MREMAVSHVSFGKENSYSDLFSVEKIGRASCRERVYVLV